MQGGHEVSLEVIAEIVRGRKVFALVCCYSCFLERRVLAILINNWIETLQGHKWGKGKGKVKVYFV